MLLFRSEEHVSRWVAAHPGCEGETVSLDRIWALAQRWFATRLDPDWRRWSQEETRAIFDSVGLTGPFWELPAAPVPPAV